jgi:hypothetical protein
MRESKNGKELESNGRLIDYCNIQNGYLFIFDRKMVIVKKGII